jgi:Restriction endonuclease
MAEDTANLASRLEHLCARILEALGYTDVKVVPRGRDAGFDITAVSPEKQSTAVEVKLYRSTRVDRRVLRNAAAALIQLKKLGSLRVILVATTILDEPDQRLLRHIGVDEVWDLSEIRKLASVEQNLGSELELLLRDAELKDLGSPPAPSGELSFDLTTQVPPEKSGEQLIGKLYATNAGNADAKRFESVCCECITYLFGSHLGQLHPQNRVEQGFQYMDLIARVVPSRTSSFWSSLAQDFRCRYVVFEFKNYTEAISQNQIHITEKYLYPNALRPVAIIIARSGIDSGARRAVLGALRESGKLVLVLDIDNLIGLLRAKDQGSEPSDLMIDHLDALLTSIAP